MKLKIILICLVILLCGGLVFTSYEWNKTNKEKKQYFSLIEKQNAIIDSMVNNPAKSVTVKVEMQVADKSKFTINGKNNSGTINVPTEKIYVLQVDFDSISTTIKEKPILNNK